MESSYPPPLDLLHSRSSTASRLATPTVLYEGSRHLTNKIIPPSPNSPPRSVPHWVRSQPSLQLEDASPSPSAEVSVLEGGPLNPQPGCAAGLEGNALPGPYSWRLLVLKPSCSMRAIPTTLVRRWARGPWLAGICSRRSKPREGDSGTSWLLGYLFLWDEQPGCGDKTAASFPRHPTELIQRQ